MNPGLAALERYPFERLRALTESIQPADLAPIRLTIGEPQHAPPESVLQVLRDQLGTINRYPGSAGLPALRETIAAWLTQRFGLEGVDPESQVLPVNGTREALFAIAQVLVTPGSANAVLCPNPFYQIYEGAALLGGTQPLFLATTESTGMLPDFAAITPAQWQACELLYICTPGNPSGAVIPEGDLQTLIQLAQQHDFIIASDECYSEIYPNEETPPVGLLQAAATMGNHDFKRCLVFHSLSKRSNLPGLRSGFVAGDPDILATFLKYRTYHGCAMPLHHQMASCAAWADETHVVENRRAYREKFDAVLPVLSPWLSVERPDAGFYLWPETPIDDERFALTLLERANVAVLPGRYLARDSGGFNPGANRARLALVAERDYCVEAAQRIADIAAAGWS